MRYKSDGFSIHTISISKQDKYTQLSPLKSLKTKKTPLISTLLPFQTRMSAFCNFSTYLSVGGCLGAKRPAWMRKTGGRGCVFGTIETK